MAIQNVLFLLVPIKCIYFFIYSDKRDLSCYC